MSENSKRKISILGSTGSIGKNTINVIREHKNLFNIIALSTNRNIDLLEKQLKEFKPKYVVICDKEAYKSFKSKYSRKNINVLYGDEGLIEIATCEETEYIVNSLVGFKGFIPTLKALQKGKICALANKETIVVGGNLIKKYVQNKNKQIIPIDSEHSAIHSLLRNKNKNVVSKIILTSSGGPFRAVPKEKLREVTLKQALAHPTWNMGSKITIDSATMMNKGFEVIEAHHLFDLEFDKIEVIIHKESIIHSMIETIDGEIYAQLSINDMKFPIQNALTYPEIITNTFQRLDLSKIKTLSFEKPDYEKFPLLKLAYEVGKKGNSLAAVLNASNEIAVNKFLNEEIKYIDIYKYISKTLEAHNIIKNPDFEDIIECDRWAREYTVNNIKKHTKLL